MRRPNLDLLLEFIPLLVHDSWCDLLSNRVALVGFGREAEAKDALRCAFRLSLSQCYKADLTP